jgi:hypothetical protein
LQTHHQHKIPPSPRPLNPVVTTGSGVLELGPVQVVLEKLKPSTGRAFSASRLWVQPTDALLLPPAVWGPQPPASFEKPTSGITVEGGPEAAVTFRSLQHKLALMREMVAQLEDDVPPPPPGSDLVAGFTTEPPLTASRRRRDLLARLEKQVGRWGGLSN